MPDPATPAVAVDALTLRGPDGTALLDAVTLSVPPATVTAVTGPSGSGKTLLLWALVGYLAPGIVHAGGTATVFGQQALSLDPDRLREFRRTRTTYVGQDPGAALPPTMKVARLVTQMTPEPDRAAAVTLLADLGIDRTHLGRRAGRLSGGEQRRVALVRGLCRGTDLVLLDEPFAGLDPHRRDLVAHHLRAWADERGATILLSGHNVDFLKTFCDTVTDIGTATATRSTRATVGQEASTDHRATMTLVARGLSAAVGRRRIVDGLDLELRAGTMTALTGPSGAGKTTLARVVTGLHSLTRGNTAAGSLRLDGRDLPLAASRRRTADRRAVQLIPQDPLSTLNPARTVGDTLQRPLRLRGVRRGAPRREGVRALLTEVGLPAGYADRYPHQISGGQRQRVAIARALAAEPAVLVCDEITSALDRATGHAVLDLLVDIMRHRRMAVLFISHDLDLVEEYCAEHYRLAGR